MLFVLLVVLAVLLFPSLALAMLQDTQKVVVPHGAVAGWVWPLGLVIVAVIIVGGIYVWRQRDRGDNSKAPRGY